MIGEASAKMRYINHRAQGWECVCLTIDAVERVLKKTFHKAGNFASSAFNCAENYWLVSKLFYTVFKRLNNSFLTT